MKTLQLYAKDYVKGNIRKLDVWSKSILDRDNCSTPLNSKEGTLLKKL